MKRVLFAIPTLFHNKELVVNCINTLRDNLTKFNITYEICVIINQSTVEFQSYDLGPGVTKLSSNLQFNISKALNTAALTGREYDYFCYVIIVFVLLLEAPLQIWVYYCFFIF